MYTVIDGFRVKDLVNHRLKFKLPLKSGSPHLITVVANVSQKYDRKLHHDLTQLVLPAEPKLVCFLQGGPGFPCPVPLSLSGSTEVLLNHGYQVVYLDQRGTGLSTPIERVTFNHLIKEVGGSPLEVILNFRADSIVEDAEAIRKALIGDAKWSILGQSYGGFCCFTYLSKYLKSLKEVLITGGVPPVDKTPDDVYTATYQRTRERNIHYFNKYPGDVAKVRAILEYLAENQVTLPNGGTLSVERFQALGILFGAHGGTDQLHQLVVKFAFDLGELGRPTYQILNAVQNAHSFDTNVIYALFQEAIYCEGSTKSNWAADRVRHHPQNKLFVYDGENVFFTGEMVYTLMFEDFAELRHFKELAYQLHAYDKWLSLYDTGVLSSIAWDDVPIVAATYVNDQYVDFAVTMEVKKNVFKDNGNLKQYVTSEYFHNGLRENPERVLGSLIKLLTEGEID